MTYYSLDDIENINDEINRLQPIIGSMCKNKKPSWNLFREVVVPIEIYLHNDSNHYGLGFKRIDETIKKYYCEFFVEYMKKNKIIDFTDYMEAFRWIGSNVHYNECGCGETGPQLCRDCYGHWYENLIYDDNISYNILFSNKGKLKLKSKYKKRISPKLLKLVYSFNYSLEEEMLMYKYTKNELIHLLKVNYCPTKYVFDKSIKYYWVKAYIRTKEWAFKTFAIKSKFNYDVLLYIRSFL